MNRLQVAALLTELVENLRKEGSWCGETHVQKAAYIAQEIAGVPLGFEFILYKHGPFSFGLRNELTSLRADGLLELEPQSFPYGPKFTVTESARNLQERFPRTRTMYAEPLKAVAVALGSRHVGELERLATALFAIAKFPEGDDRERATWINLVKPHVSIAEALAAIDEVKELEAQFSAEGNKLGAN